ncbi:MAG TPA: hypothetical protein VL068_01320 [Microthrixaceae bacterium]|nr:hypothetical protein [Microthrixaceae bacterium]
MINHWDGDDCAVGIARSGIPRRLVYVSTFEKSPDRYAYECETPVGPNDSDCEVVWRSDDVTYDELLQVIEGHLGELQ